MRRGIFLFLVCLCGVSAVLGQVVPSLLPPPPSTPAEPQGELTLPRPENLVGFNPAHAELRWDGSSWQLWAGRVKLKEFGSEPDAREALRLIRELRLSQRGAIGTPRPVMEYWLTDGQAPAGLHAERQAAPFDPDQLRVEPIEGQLYLRDDELFLFNFGPHAEDAQQALAVIKRHGFNRIGYVGQPTPVMVYFLASRQARPTRPPVSKEAKKETPNDPRIMLARLQTRQLASASLPLREPKIPGERVPLDPARVEVRRDAQDWKLVFDHYLLASFGVSESQAREAQRMVRQCRFTEHCRVGAPEPSFTYFLVNGQPPRGVPFGVYGESFRPEHLAVRSKGAGAWAIFEGSRLLFSFRDEKIAQHALQLIRLHQFDCVCHVGPPAPLGMTFLVRGR